MKIVCLANSFRVGGRCLGGIQLDDNDVPIFENGRPKWIRPVCDTENEQVPTHQAAHISLLDVIEFESIRNTGHGHQSENVLFKGNLNVTSHYSQSQLDRLIENDKFRVIFENRGKAVPADIIGNIDYSLKLLKVDEFEVNEKTYENKEYPQIRLSFKYANNLYDLPVTDPVFLHKYNLNNDVLEGNSHLYLTLSLAAPFNDWYYKLVAGVILSNHERSVIEAEPLILLPF